MKEVKKSGFTLIELLGILVLIAIIGLIAFVAIDKSLKSGKDNAYEKQIKLIELAAKNWASDNLDKLPDAGKFITVDFMTLKMYGYLDVKVSDPITGLCFPNDAFVSIVHSGATDQMLYEVNRDSLNNGQLACDEYSKDMLDDPNIAVAGSVNTLGKDQYATLTVAYNYENLDESKIHFKEEVLSGENATKSEFNITDRRYNSEKKLYEMDIQIRAGWHEHAVAWIEIEKGAITLSDGRQSNFVSSSEIYIDNAVLNADKSISYVCTAGKCPFSSAEEVLGPVSYGGLCMDNNNSDSVIATMGEFYAGMEINGSFKMGGIIYNGEQRIKLSVQDKPNSQIYYYVYRLLDASGNESSKLYKYSETKWAKGRPDKNWSTSDSSGKHDLSISAIENGTYYVEVCDANSNCNDVGPYELQYNDCQTPTIVSGYKDSTQLNTLFSDYPSVSQNYNGIPVHNSSSVLIIGAVIMPFPELDFAFHLKYYNEGGLSAFESIGYKTYSGLDFSYKSLGTVRQQAINDRNYCGDSYLYIVASDVAGNITLHKEPLGYLNCESYIPPVDEGGEQIEMCDAICQMKQNSDLWLTCDSEFCQDQLHEDNTNICNEAFDGNCSFDENSGHWSVCDAYSCSELY